MTGRLTVRPSSFHSTASLPRRRRRQRPRRQGHRQGETLDPGAERNRQIYLLRSRQSLVGRAGRRTGQADQSGPRQAGSLGDPEFIAQEELGRYAGYWWSPKDNRIAVERYDDSPVDVLTRAAIGAAGTTTFQQRYPAAGTHNADVSLYLVDPNGAHKVHVDLGPNRDIYLARVNWAPDGKKLYVQRLNRAQTTLDMIVVDPATGKSKILFSERAAPSHWINLGDDYKFLDDGSLIWSSERNGYAHLYRFADRKWTQLTSGPWVVKTLAGVDQKAHRLYFTGTKDD